MLRNYVLYATGSTPGVLANQANYSVPRPGTIKQIQLVTTWATDADGYTWACLALNQAASPFGTSTGAAPSPIMAIVTTNGNITTSGANNCFCNAVIPLAQKVVIGDIVYLHLIQSGAGTWFQYAILTVEEAG